MSRIAHPSEKVLALAGVYRALATELEGSVDPADPRVQVALLHVSSDIAMHTDTRDMGVMSYLKTTSAAPFLNERCDDCGEVGGTHNPLVEH